MTETIGNTCGVVWRSRTPVRLLSALAFCAALLFSPAFAAEEDLAAQIAKEVARCAGTEWFGVYFMGKQKCGFARIDISKTKVGETDAYSAAMSMDLNIRMMGAAQKIVVIETRYYRLTGELLRIESVSDTSLGKVSVVCEVVGDKLRLSHTASGRTRNEELPVPNESLASAIASRRLVKKGETNATVEFEMFEATMAKPIKVTSKLLRFEERLIGGVTTRVAVVESTFQDLNIKTTEYLTAEGDMLETVTGGFFTLRREAERVAKDVRSSFDALRAGIIPVKAEIGPPDKVVSLKLKISGIENKDLLIDDAQQTWERGGEGKEAAHVVMLRAAEAPKESPALPIVPGPDDKELAKCLEASKLAQSDAPEIIAAAKKIVGDTTDSWQAAQKINDWVYRKVKKKGLAAMSEALGVLKQMEGDCSEHSILFVALCRAAGIPARQVVGVAYTPKMKGFGYHAWAEVYVGKWVAMDPTWGETLADPTHLKFGAGEMDSIAVISGLFGSLQIEVVEVKAGRE